MSAIAGMEASGLRTAPRSTSWRSTSGRRRRTASAERPRADIELAVSLDRGSLSARRRRVALGRAASRGDRCADRPARRDGDPPGRTPRRSRRNARCGPASNSDTRWATSTGRRWSRDNTVYVPLDRRPQGDGVGDEDPSLRGNRLRIRPGPEVMPYLAPHESRRLFGGAEGPVHTMLTACRMRRSGMPTCPRRCAFVHA